MDPTDFIERLRNHYVDQLREFIARQEQGSERCSGEVKLRLSDESALFDRLYCVDFIREDKIIELAADYLAFEPIIMTFGEAEVAVEELRWDDIIFHHDVSGILDDGIAAWFGQWFDLEDTREAGADGLSNVIHSLLLEPGRICIDLGSAEPQAFWEMLELIVNSGAKSIRISTSQATEETSDV